MERDWVPSQGTTGSSQMTIQVQQAWNTIPEFYDGMDTPPFKVAITAEVIEDVDIQFWQGAGRVSCKLWQCNLYQYNT